MEDTANLHDLEEFEDALSLCDLEEFEDTLSFSDLPIHNQEQPYPEYQNSPSNQDFFEFAINTNPITNPTLDNIIFCGKIIPQKHVPTNLFNDQSRTSNSKSSSPLEMKLSDIKKSSSSTTRKHKVLIGLEKVPSEMKLSDIKKRQNRRAPSPMFPVVNGKEPAVSGGGGSSYWGLLRPLRLFANASLGCIPHV